MTLGHLGPAPTRHPSNAGLNHGNTVPLSSGPSVLGGGSAVVRSEPISLGTLDRDCFVIPVHSVDRFLPAGIPVGVYHSRSHTKQFNRLSLKF